jgi:hypothetical protein
MHNNEYISIIRQQSFFSSHTSFSQHVIKPNISRSVMVILIKLTVTVGKFLYILPTFTFCRACFGNESKRWNIVLPFSSWLLFNLKLHHFRAITQRFFLYRVHYENQKHKLNGFLRHTDMEMLCWTCCHFYILV